MRKLDHVPTSFEDLVIPPERAGRIWFVDHRRSPMVHPHRHHEVEVNLVVRGQVHYRVMEQRVDLRRDALIWLYPDQDHLLFKVSPDLQMWVWVIKTGPVARACSAPLANALAERNPPGLHLRSVDPNHARQIAETLRHVAEHEADVDSFNTGLLHATALAFRAYGLAQPSRGHAPARSSRLSPPVEEAARVLADEDRSLADLAQALGQSPAHLSRLFHRQMGVRLVDYRNQMRIRRFLAHYRAGHGTTLLEAALRAGFGSYPQFSRVFTQLMGMSPSAYARRPAAV